MRRDSHSPNSRTQHAIAYRVWAPAADDVVLSVNGTSVPLKRDAAGWWSTDRLPQHGDRYGYVIDGEGPYPDPRSCSQPEGVDALSEFIDHARFAWSDQRWQAPPLASGVVYELHIGTFTPEGTFDAAIECLPHLAELGVTHVEVMPVNEFSGTHGWGYDGVDLFAPHHAYGGPDGFKRFVNRCHEHGLAVILDVVYNHLGPAGNYLRRFGPYFTSRYHTPWGEAVNLDDAGSPEVRRFFCDNAKMWLRDYHVDGLRIDAVHAFVDTSAVHLLEQLSTDIDRLEAALGRHFVLIAESDLNDPRIVRPREAWGYGMDAQWNDDFHHALHSVLTGETSGYYKDFGRLRHLATAIQQAFVYAGDHSDHRERRHGRPPDNMPGWRFVVAAQNHDQVGNRARGDRLSHLVSTRRLKIGAAILLTAPFVPMLFQGEEWAASTPFQYFTSHADPELGQAVSEGRRREFAAFGWRPEDVPDPQGLETFLRSKLRWDERSQPPHRDMLAWYQALIGLRHSTPGLLDGDFERCDVRWDEEARWIRIDRRPLVVACNLGEAPYPVPLDGPARVVLSSDAAVRVENAACLLSAESVAILQRS